MYSCLESDLLSFKTISEPMNACGSHFRLIFLISFFIAQFFGLHLLNIWFNSSAWVHSLNPVAFTILATLLWYGLIGILPVYFYVRIIEKKNFLCFVGLNRTPRNVWKLLCLLFFFVLFYNIVSDSLLGKLRFVDTFSFFTIVAIILSASIAEEVIFVDSRIIFSGCIFRHQLQFLLQA